MDTDLEMPDSGKRRGVCGGCRKKYVNFVANITISHFSYPLPMLQYGARDESHVHRKKNQHFTHETINTGHLCGCGRNADVGAIAETDRHPHGFSRLEL